MLPAADYVERASAQLAAGGLEIAYLNACEAVKADPRYGEAYLIRAEVAKRVVAAGADVDGPTVARWKEDAKASMRLDAGCRERAHALLETRPKVAAAKAGKPAAAAEAAAAAALKKKEKETGPAAAAPKPHALEALTEGTGGLKADYKTKLCKSWMINNKYCPDGPACTFAHGLEELRKAPAPLAALANHPRYKVKLCDHWATGRCAHGAECHFAHGQAELRKFGAKVKDAGPEDDTRSHPFYKTRLCREFETDGHCPRGAGCKYAHGQDELRSVGPTPPPASATAGDKTLLCHDFAMDGVCGKGDACPFAHGLEELRKPAPRQEAEEPEGWDSQTQYYKTRLCKAWEADGYCFKGADCTYAHGQAELRKFGAKEQDAAPEDNPFYKTRLCRAWEAQGHCPKGADCTFAHGCDDLRSPWECMETTGPATAPEDLVDVGGPNPEEGPAHASTTQLCRDWMKHGDYPRQRACGDAHGIADLPGERCWWCGLSADTPYCAATGQRHVTRAEAKLRRDWARAEYPFPQDVIDTHDGVSAVLHAVAYADVLHVPNDAVQDARRWLNEAFKRATKDGVYMHCPSTTSKALRFTPWCPETLCRACARWKAGHPPRPPAPPPPPLKCVWCGLPPSRYPFCARTGQKHITVWEARARCEKAQATWGVPARVLLVHPLVAQAMHVAAFADVLGVPSAAVGDAERWLSNNASGRLRQTGRCIYPGDPRGFAAWCAAEGCATCA